MRVLLIENDFADQQLINLALSKTGIEMDISNVSTIGEIKKRSPEKGFDFIFVRYDMPHMNGVEFSRYIRKKGCKTPIVVIVQTDDDNIAQQAISAGATNYITKEILHPYLLRTIIRSTININKSEQKILSLLQRQENIIESANIGTWEWDLEKDQAILNNKWF